MMQAMMQAMMRRGRQMKRHKLKLGAALLLCFIAPFAQGLFAGGDLVKIKISWRYVDLDAEMKIYEPASQRPIEMWQTESVASLDLAPVSKEIQDSTLVMKAGETKKFVLVLENNSKKPIYFFAAPHVVEPDYFSFGFKFKCLCINHAFMVDAGEVWYRIVEMRLSDDFVGDKIEISHSLVALTEERAKSIGK